MVINNNNSQINAFNKGMNSDTAFDQIENSQYVFGKNVRITRNQNIGKSNEPISSHEGIVAPVSFGEQVPFNHAFQGDIIYTGSIDNTAVVITKVSDGDYQSMYIYRFYIKEYRVNNTQTVVDRVTNFTVLYRCSNVWKTGEDPDQISAVIYKELDNVVKLYVATGKHPIACFRIDKDSDSLHNTDVQIDDYINNRIIPAERVRIEGVIQGRLLTSQVQYTYRLYNKYGNTTQLAPLTNKIQVIDPSRSKEIGNAENTETSVGFTLSIKLDDTKFERIQVYRLSYIKPNANADVHLIYDGKVKKDSSSNKFVLNDVGIEPLQELTMEEFSAMSGLILIPQCIEQNQEYLFCANVKDDTVLQGIGPSTTGSTNLQTVTTDVVLSSSVGGQIPTIPTETFKQLYTTIGNIQVTDYFNQHGVNPNNIVSSYNDMFTSSMLRSLRRGEQYKYAIVYYDKYGRRTDVKEIGIANVEEIQQSKPFTIKNGKLIAHPIGVKITIPQPVDKNGQIAQDIIGCQIVRRSSSELYQKTLLQVALAKPIRQGLLDVKVDATDYDQIDEWDDTRKSPYYPTGLMSVQDIRIYPNPYNNIDLQNQEAGRWIELEGLKIVSDSNKLFQVFSSEIDFRRNDVLSKLSFSDLKLETKQYMSATCKKFMDNTVLEAYLLNNDSIPEYIKFNKLGANILIMRNGGWVGQYEYLDDRFERIKKEEKSQIQWIFTYYNAINSRQDWYNNYAIRSVKDVKIADSASGFSNHLTDDTAEVKSAIKKYRSYTTSIDEFVYNNWVSFGKYDFPTGSNDINDNFFVSDNLTTTEFIARHNDYNLFVEKATGEDIQYGNYKWTSNRQGYIGPGPSCFLIDLESDANFSHNIDAVYTAICNITHNRQIHDLQSEEFEQYYGFGNFFNLYPTRDGTYKTKVTIELEDTIKDYYTNEVFVFDGDIYITPHEFTTMFKAYDFMSYDTLQSTQVTNYIPLESKVNTYFDYGKNLLNTGSANLLYEPGSIDGVTTQDRPLHQYNMIYSDNDASNDVFTLITTDENETNNFKQRAYYSELKTNGEFIDNFMIFKPAAFIDVDSKYGEITNLMTDRNNLYYWQDTAFGKFSVNERSLVNDQNGNTIMLGQAGILSRYDYLSTKFGMRPQDFCATSAENGVFWIDITNKAVVGYTGQQVVNYGEQVNVQNIINEYIRSDKNTYNRPKIDYDVQNSELLCKFLNDDNQLIFNLKYNLATSIYTRRYRDIIYIKNAMFGIAYNIPRTLLKYNYIQSETNYLSPLELQFVVNPMASVVKVYDSQQLVPIKRNKYNHRETGYNVYDYINDKVDVYTDVASHILDNTTMHFETDLTNSNESVKASTDREGNIIYNIPRFVERNNLFGNRIRGKWMKVDIVKDNPDEYFTISHVLTKFRQSYS